MKKGSLLKVKRGLCFAFALALILPLTALSAGDGLQQILDQLSLKMPVASMGYGEYPAGRMYVDLFLTPTSVLEGSIPSYVLYARSVLAPHIKDRKVSFYTINMMDDWGKVVFEYSSKGATYGSLVDRRSGKKVKTKFKSTLDLMAYFPAYLPTKTDLISEDQLTLLNDALQYFVDNPGANSKKAAKALAKSYEIKEKALLAEINSAFEALYAIAPETPKKGTLLKDYQSSQNP